MNAGLPMSSRKRRLVVVATASFLLPVVAGFAILFTILQQRAQLAPYDPRVRHRVTREMASQTEEMATKPAPAFSAPGSDGRDHSLSNLLDHGPLLLTFVNVDCPCSKDAEPMFQALADAYPDLAVVGVVGAARAESWKWGREQRVRHLLLADPDFRVIRAYGAVSSVYTALITQRGKIVTMWPGYSQSMMADVSRKAADLLGAPVRTLPTKLAPVEMAAGCAFPAH
jgi:peroxiredoxin